MIHSAENQHVLEALASLCRALVNGGLYSGAMPIAASSGAVAVHWMRSERTIAVTECNFSSTTQYMHSAYTVYTAYTGEIGIFQQQSFRHSPVLPSHPPSPPVESRCRIGDKQNGVETGHGLRERPGGHLGRLCFSFGGYWNAPDKVKNGPKTVKNGQTPFKSHLDSTSTYRMHTFIG